MFTNLYTFLLILIFCEAATKIGLGNGRPSEEPSSLKTEIMKFKTSECGGSSSEEQMHSHSKNKKQKNRRRKDSNEDDDDDDSEEDKKKKNGRGKNNNGRKNSRGHREEFISGYGSTSYEGTRNFGMNRRPEDDYMNRKDPFQTHWGDPHSNPRPNPYNPYGGTLDEDFYPNNRRPNSQNNRNQDRQDPYNSRPASSYGNRGGYPSQDRDDERYYNRDDRYSNRDRNRDSNRDRDFSRDSKRKHGHNNWNESQEDESRNSGRRSGSRRSSGRGKGNKKNKNDSSDGECVSQCVFNNMEIMEDDGIPSEAGMIKWAQDKIKNEKLKQAAIKEIRKCFGTLASSDGENSCNFSKSLAQCLKLNLDDDKD